MNPDPTHRIMRIEIVKNSEIAYCDWCGIFATHPDIEKPCRRRPDLLAELKRLETLNRGATGTPCVFC